MTVSDIKTKKFIIIVGQPKSGTTSLYTWLSKHPKICASIIKETRFFLDQNSLQPRKLKFTGNNIDQYLDLFPSKDAEFYLEASPDYLYDELPLSLNELLPNSYLIIIERNPLDRMLSCYRYFQQQGRLPLSLSFDDFIDQQIKPTVVNEPNNPFQCLHQCKRSFIIKFQKKYGDRCLVFNFDKLKKNPDQIIRECYEKIGLAHDKMEQDYRAHNVSKETRLPQVTKYFRNARRVLSYSLIKFPRIRKLLGYVSKGLQNYLYRTSKSMVKIDVSSKTRKVINDIAAQ